VNEIVAWSSIYLIYYSIFSTVAIAHQIEFFSPISFKTFNLVLNNNIQITNHTQSHEYLPNYIGLKFFLKLNFALFD